MLHCTVSPVSGLWGYQSGFLHATVPGKRQSIPINTRVVTRLWTTRFNPDAGARHAVGITPDGIWALRRFDRRPAGADSAWYASRNDADRPGGRRGTPRGPGGVQSWRVRHRKTFPDCLKADFHGQNRCMLHFSRAATEKLEQRAGNRSI